jgi:uncharacterized protein DUF4381
MFQPAANPLAAQTTSLCFTWVLHTTSMMLLLAETANDIVPPVNYSLVPPWMIFVGSGLVLTVLGLAFWYGRKLFHKEKALPTPRERALGALTEMEKAVERMNPYQFSIRVSDILRRYVMEQFDLPMTRQTSVEFLNAIGPAAKFTGEEKTLLADFLNRCDLIKFARYDATSADSHLLLDEARQFVKGGMLVTA